MGCEHPKKKRHQAGICDCFVDISSTLLHLNCASTDKRHKAMNNQTSSADCEDCGKKVN